MKLLEVGNPADQWATWGSFKVKNWQEDRNVLLLSGDEDAVFGRDAENFSDRILSARVGWS